MQKFSSNVVEKCLELCNNVIRFFKNLQPLRDKFIEEMFSPNKIISLVKNKYGNFVLTKCINLMDRAKKEEVKCLLLTKANITAVKERQKFESIIKLLSN